MDHPFILTISEENYKSHNLAVEFISKFIKKNHLSFEDFFENHIKKEKYEKENFTQETLFQHLSCMKEIPKRKRKILKDPNRIKQKTYFTTPFPCKKNALVSLCKQINVKVDKETYNISECTVMLYRFLKRGNPKTPLSNYTVDKELIDLFPGLEKIYPVGFHFKDTKKEFKKMLHYIIEQFLLNKPNKKEVKETKRVKEIDETPTSLKSTASKKPRVP